jgi:hypothetical protein
MAVMVRLTFSLPPMATGFRPIFILIVLFAPLVVAPPASPASSNIRLIEKRLALQAIRNPASMRWPIFTE